MRHGTAPETASWTCARCPAVLVGVPGKLCIECELAAKVTGESAGAGAGAVSRFAHAGHVPGSPLVPHGRSRGAGGSGVLLAGGRRPSGFPAWLTAPASPLCWTFSPRSAPRPPHWLAAADREADFAAWLAGVVQGVAGAEPFASWMLSVVSAREAPPAGIY
jgi:hypothetical protein